MNINVKVIGLGNSGINATNLMIKENLSNVEYIAIDTDEDTLETSNAENKILLEKT